MLLLTRSIQRWFDWPHCAHHAAALGQLPAFCFKASDSCDVWSSWPSPFQPQSFKQLNPLVSIFLGPLSIDVGTHVPNWWPLSSKVMSAHAWFFSLVLLHKRTPYVSTRIPRNSWSKSWISLMVIVYNLWSCGLSGGRPYRGDEKPT